jgi:hypothetical protein
MRSWKLVLGLLVVAALAGVALWMSDTSELNSPATPAPTAEAPLPADSVQSPPPAATPPVGSPRPDADAAAREAAREAQRRLQALRQAELKRQRQAQTARQEAERPPPAGGRVSKSDQNIRAYSRGLDAAQCVTDWQRCLGAVKARELSAPGAQGELTDAAATLSDGSPYDLWVYRGKRREELVIGMQSAGLDTYLLIAHGGTILGDDDDGGGGTNSQLRMTLPADGVYLIVANAVGARSRGTYTLSVRSDP